MPKIPKNLSDQEMVKHFKEKITFETGLAQDGPEDKRSVQTKSKEKESFFTPELQEKVSKHLLEIKIQLFQEGIVDYDLKVSRDGKQVLISAVPRPVKQQPDRNAQRNR